MNTINPTPQLRFQSDTENIANHRRLIDQPAFELACDTALAEYTRRLTTATQPDPSAAAGSFLRIMGAQELVHILKNLAETPPQIVQLPKGNLNHRA